MDNITRKKTGELLIHFRDGNIKQIVNMLTSKDVTNSGVSVSLLSSRIVVQDENLLSQVMQLARLEHSENLISIKAQLIDTLFAIQQETNAPIQNIERIKAIINEEL